MKKEDNPCFGCVKRHSKCQSTCEEGKAAAIILAKEKLQKKQYWQSYGNTIHPMTILISRKK